jgi:hypothetical protein
MLSKAWSGAHPAHVVQSAFFEPQVIPGFPNGQKWILIYFFHLLSPLIVTEVPQGEFGASTYKTVPTFSAVFQLRGDWFGFRLPAARTG